EELLGGEPVALHLAGRDRRRYLMAVLVDHRAAAVLPGLVLRAEGGARLVLEVAVPVGVAVLAGPLQNAPGDREVPPRAFFVRGPGVVLRHADHEHQRRSEVAVIGGVRVVAEPRAGTGAHLLRNAPG